MWKWTDFDNIKVIILDIDSLTLDFLLFSYKEFIPNVQLYFVKHVDTPDRFDLNQHIITYFDISFLLQEVLTESKCESTSVISISNNPLFLKEMMQNHIGTILTSELKKDFLKHTPDFTQCTIDNLPKILLRKRKGYAAEVYATYNQGLKTISLLQCHTEIYLNDGEKKSVDFYFGGRYYSDVHKYIFNDPLSYVVQGFKNNYISTVDNFFDEAIKFIRRRESIDKLTFIPLKPNDILEQKFDRFASLKLEKNSRDGFQLENILWCKKDFTQKGSNSMKRRENPKGAYEVLTNQNVNGKNIIIIDDVLSTGATLSEAIKTLYESGANKVIALVLAVNQLTESFLEYQHLTCPYCNSPMILRMNHKTGKLFFGCKKYMQHENEKFNLDVDKGLFSLKNQNKLVVSSIIDLNDEY